MIKKIIAVTLVALFAATFMQQPATHAAEQKPAATEPAYTYTAKSGDSYSVLARKAIQTYGIVNNVKLSLAQILAAENALTAQAGSPDLSEGQVVSLTQSNVKSAMDAAKKLSPADEAAWNTYVPYVNFDTRSNG
jgi:hypothetical protein